MLRQKVAKAPKAQKVAKKAAKVQKKKVVKSQKRAFRAPVGYKGPTVGESTLSQPFPETKAQQVLPDGSVKPFSTADLQNGTHVLVSFPLAFTFVCPTEVNSFSDALPKFKEQGAQVYGLSIDSPFTLQAWLKQPKNKGGIEGCQLPLISDLGREVSAAMGCLLPNNIGTRATMIIKDGKVRHFSFNETSVGRDVNEVLRVVSAINMADTGVVVPCDWKPGKKTMKPSQQGLEEYVNDV
eukprot:UN02598